jgi:hypothetical protein
VNGAAGSGIRFGAGPARAEACLAFERLRISALPA